jgi:hypothetical protein
MIAEAKRLAATGRPYRARERALGAPLCRQGRRRTHPAGGAPRLPARQVRPPAGPRRRRPGPRPPSSSPSRA